MPGTGSALRRGCQEVAGDIIVIQDADPEYAPDEVPQLVESITQGKRDVVYGLRFLRRQRAFMFAPRVGTKFLTFGTSLLCELMSTDMATCDNARRVAVGRSRRLKSNPFGVEPEPTANIFKRGFRLKESPIRDTFCGYEQGDKITWRAGVTALQVLLKYRLVE